MNKLSLSVLAGVVASGTIATLQPSAQAASFSFNAQDAVSAGCVGQTTCTVNDFFTLSTTTTRNGQPPLITQKTVGGVLGLGIDSSLNKDGETARNQSVGEIDIDEIFKVDFKKAGVLKSLDLSFLYRPGVYADDVFEVALVTADNGIKTGTLTVTGLASAVWSLGGTVLNLSPSRKDDGGSYSIINPFGDLKIKGISMTAVQQKDANNKLPAGAKNSDFALSRVEVTKVPEPATLLGLGVVGLAAFARRRQVAKAD